MTRAAVLSWLLLVAACGPRAVPRGSIDLTTTAETSGWIRTGRYDEAVRLCRDLARAYPDGARCERYGVTPEGRDQVALVVAAGGALTPEDALAQRRPVILVQAGIHAGEIEGKDAGFVLLRDMLDGKLLPGVLGAITVVFVPVVNPDGHERFGPAHRINQRGPAEMGFRTTAQNLNLNRDYVKVDAPEMAALLELFARWQPVVYVDLHTTDGAKFEHDVAVLVAPLGPRPDGLERTARALSDGLQARLTALGHLPLDFYPSFIDGDDPTSGFATGDAPPRFSQAYAAARDRIGVLVETHSWRTYKERAQAMRDLLIALFERGVTDGTAWQKAVDDAAAAATRLGGTDVVLLSSSNEASRTIDFRGYAYERKPSEISGGIWTVYDETTPQVWKVPLHDTMAPGLTVRAPRGGYLVPAAYAELVAPRLDRHRVRFGRTVEAVRVEDALVFRADSVKFAPGPFEGRTRATISGAWKPEVVTLGPGALWVPIGQPGARLALFMFEPTSSDSLAAWGFFNAVFEQKEYREAYVAEEVAREMLADPAVRTAFESWLAADPDRAKSADERLDFFYRRHPSWDAQKDRLPIVKTDTVPAEMVVP